MSHFDIKRIDQRPMQEALLSRNKFHILGLDTDTLIRYFFSGNAWVAIIVLGLITYSLFREGAGFFPQHWEGLKTYRLAGLEFVDIIRDQSEAQAGLVKYLDKVRVDRAAELKKSGASGEEVAQKLQALEQVRNDLDAAGIPLQEFVQQMTQQAAGVKDRWTEARDNAISRDQLLKAGMAEEAKAIAVEKIDFGREASALTARIPQYHEISRTMAARLADISGHLPQVQDPVVAREIRHLQKALENFTTGFPDVEKRLQDWRYDRPVSAYESLTKFIFGTQWITQSFWQDWYGFVPLFMGSLTISVVALVISVPLGIGAAVYINQVASAREQTLIKPAIEFIAVIPSVVLGFFGVVILGEFLRQASGWSWLAWVPGFPFPERLNILTAGILLALMAVPSIFTFSEDALNNVPKAFKEASFALGANRLQTIVRIIIPASLSGIISAVLLGFGRVIGETMVVLLCAGNRIQIPDFAAGLAVVAQPVHTMTGLVAQEIPEVVKGSLQYRALFMLSIMLFLISLLINYIAQIFVRKFKISVG